MFASETVSVVCEESSNSSVIGANDSEELLLVRFAIFPGRMLVRLDVGGEGRTLLGCSGASVGTSDCGASVMIGFALLLSVSDRVTMGAAGNGLFRSEGDRSGASGREVCESELLSGKVREVEDARSASKSSKETV